MLADGDVPQQTPFLELVDVSAGYGGPPVISDVSMTLERGEVVAVIGPNGAGKSTLVKALLGELRVSAGTIRMDGRDVTRLSSHKFVRTGVGYVPQRNDVFDGLTVRENLAMGGYLLRRREVDKRMEEIIGGYFPQLAGMLNRTARKLSGGERKMLAIARALMPMPELLVLDEPTANLAPELSSTLLNTHARNLATRGTAILLIEQRVAAALEVADRGYLMVSGTPRLTGTGPELAAREDMAELFLGAQLPTIVHDPVDIGELTEPRAGSA